MGSANYKSMLLHIFASIFSIGRDVWFRDDKQKERKIKKIQEKRENVRERRGWGGGMKRQRGYGGKEK